MLQKIQFRAGINKEGTSYANEGGWYDSDKVRFRSGYPEKIGGWINQSPSYTFKGVVRSMWNWISLTSDNLLGIGTNQKYYVERGGQYNDITPIAASSTINNNPFATTNGSLLVTVTDTSHGASSGTYVTFSGASAVAGLTLNGEYEIVSVANADTYTIISATAANATTTGGGASVVAAYQVSAGSSTYTTNNGWGAGVYGRGGWGSAASVGVGSQLRLWSNDNYGQDLVIGIRGGAVYYWAKDTSTYARAILLSTASTNASYSGTYVPHTVLHIVASDVQRFAVAFGANGYTPGNPSTTFNPMLVRWSDQENIYDWVPTATNQAGEYPLSNGSTIVTGRHTRQETLVWTDSAVYSMQYQGPPFVYGFTLLMDNISIISPNAPMTVNSVTYWMGVDKFYMYSGRVETLPCTLRTYVFTDINQDQAFQIVAGSNEGFNEVWWFYPSSSSLVNDRYVVYNHLERIWYHGDLSRSFWLDSPLRQYPMSAYSVQNSYLAVALTVGATSVTLIDGSSYPMSGTVTIESEQITYTSVDSNTLLGCTRGANSTTAATHVIYTPVTNTTPNQIMYQEYECDDVSTGVAVGIEAHVSSSDFDIGDGHNFGFVWRMLPDMSFAGSTATNPSATIELRPRQNSGTNYGASSTPTVTRTATVPVEQYTGAVYVRLRGRQMSFKVESTDIGVAWQLGTPRIDIRPDGRKS